MDIFVKNTTAGYPTWEGSDKRQWDAFGGYNKLEDNIEHFTNDDKKYEHFTNDEISTYQEFLYSVVVYYYIHDKKLGYKKLKKTKNIRLKNIKKDEIPELDYDNTTEEDIKSDYTVVLVDITTYLPNQPTLRMKCIVNKGERMLDIEFIREDPVDMKKREYRLELPPFTEIKFIFDLGRMN